MAIPIKEDVTSVKVKPDTLQGLRNLREPGQTFDDVISELLEQEYYASEEFRTDHERRLKEKGIPAEVVFKRLGL